MLMILMAVVFAIVIMLAHFDCPFSILLVHKMSSQQIKQREKEYPYYIDKVPVKTCDLDRSVVF